MPVGDVAFEGLGLPSVCPLSTTKQDTKVNIKMEGRKGKGWQRNLNRDSEMAVGVHVFRTLGVGSPPGRLALNAHCTVCAPTCPQTQRPERTASLMCSSQEEKVPHSCPGGKAPESRLLPVWPPSLDRSVSLDHIPLAGRLEAHPPS